MFGKKKKKEKISDKKRIQDMDDFELVAAQYETLDEYYKINEKIDGVMLVGSAAAKALLVGGVFAVFSFFGAFSGVVKNFIDFLVPITMIGGALGRVYYNSKEEEVEKLIDEAEGLEEKYENFKQESNRRYDEFQNEKNGREIFPELRPMTDEDIENMELLEGVEDKWLM